MKDKKTLIIGATVVLLIVVVAVGGATIFLKKPKKEEAVAIKKETIKHEVVDKLYDKVKGSECTPIPSVKSSTKVEDLEQETILYFIFSHLDENKKLKDEIDLTTYENSVKEVYGTANLSSDFSSYSYGGYIYKHENNKIVREATPCGSRKYISSLYGYTNNEDTLESRVHLGYIENGMVYSLDGKELGTYEEEKIASILDQSTSQVYIYDRIEGKYYLKEIKVD